MTLAPRPQDQDTICAQTSPPGKGGVAMIRVSGPKALPIVQNICSFLPTQPQSHRIFYGPLTYKKQTIDEVVVLFFEKNKSFTSDPVLEICSHGSPVVCQEILQALIDLGCRMAEKGEFSYRAFVSGRMDLLQAESVLQLINSSSVQSKKQAMEFLTGRFSKKIKDIKNKIFNILTHLEASIDFSEESLSLISTKETKKLLLTIVERVEILVQSYKKGVYVREGLKVVLIGGVNVGKSTLLNCFLKESKAIVSSTPGTTRDVVTGSKYIEGQKIYFSDTAGIRETQNEIENLGKKKTYEALYKCDIPLFVIDGSNEDFKTTTHMIKDVLKKASNPSDLVFIVNKIDLKNKKDFLKTLHTDHPYINNLISQHKTFFTSAFQGIGVNEVEKFLIEKMQGGEFAPSLERHYDLLSQSLFYLKKACHLCDQNEIPLDLISFELRESLKPLQALTGEEVDVDVVDNIFKQFCIGK